eukprot:scaffold71480_cov38-Prasinocladus_malaysianus.AAC.1
MSAVVRSCVYIANCRAVYVSALLDNDRYDFLRVSAIYEHSRSLPQQCSRLSWAFYLLVPVRASSRRDDGLRKVYICKMARKCRRSSSGRTRADCSELAMHKPANLGVSATPCAFYCEEEYKTYTARLINSRFYDAIIKLCRDCHLLDDDGKTKARSLLRPFTI